MQVVRSSLIGRGIPTKDISYEVFGPDLWLADFQ
jgi:nitric oxide dioxygenase